LHRAAAAAGASTSCAWFGESAKLMAPMFIMVEGVNSVFFCGPMEYLHGQEKLKNPVSQPQTTNHKIFLLRLIHSGFGLRDKGRV
jgi:hypothetical protein